MHGMAYKFAYICQWCGGEAFYTDIKPSMGELVKSEDFVLPDGSHPTEGSQIICPRCQQPLPTMFSENVVETGKYHHHDL